jgi:hypothetical protein
MLVTATVLLSAGCRDSEERREPAADAPSSPSASSVDHADADLWLSFEETSAGYDGTPVYEDAAGGPAVAGPVTAHGGEVSEVAGADGSAVAVEFPPRCADPGPCPRALVEVASDDGLNPGRAPFEYGASVWLAPDQTTSGSNILQKGRFGTGGGQWKLQVDDPAGRPSCVVRSDRGDLVVASSVSIADSRWHHVVCRRAAEGISISVDGIERRRDGRTGSVSNPWPVRIGSPGTGDDDDQYHGRIDDVFVRVLPRPGA